MELQDRKFLSRGKRKKDNQWIIGYYTKLHPSNDWNVAIGDEDSQIATEEQHFIITGSVCYGSYVLPRMEEVYAKSIGKCIGLEDKNGRILFEPDLIQCDKKLYYLAWSPLCSHFAAYPISKTKIAPCLNIGTMKSIEVVGNLYDNEDMRIATEESLRRGEENVR